MEHPAEALRYSVEEKKGPRDGGALREILQWGRGSQCGVWAVARGEERVGYYLRSSQRSAPVLSLGMYSVLRTPQPG